jgi:hypothetical protein
MTQAFYVWHTISKEGQIWLICQNGNPGPNAFSSFRPLLRKTREKFIHPDATTPTFEAHPFEGLYFGLFTLSSVCVTKQDSFLKAY